MASSRSSCTPTPGCYLACERDICCHCNHTASLKTRKSIFGSYLPTSSQHRRRHGLRIQAFRLLPARCTPGMRSDRGRHPWIRCESKKLLVCPANNFFASPSGHPFASQMHPSSFFTPNGAFSSTRSST